MSEDRISSRFADIWRERNRIQLAIAKDGVDNDWAKGRNQFLAFLIRIRDEKLTGKIIEIQDMLSTIPCIDPFPKDYLHITVKGCGFLAESPEHEDDIPIEKLQTIIDQATEILHTPRFRIRLPKLNLFPSVVFLEVHDNGRIGEMNRELQSICGIRRMRFDYPLFLPHISIAQFQNEQEFDRLINYLERLRDVEFGETTTGSIELVIAHINGRYPQLESIHAFELRQF